jgi:Tfp pilus assembly protein PilX
MALVLVVGSMLILAMVALTALAYTLKSQRFARYDQDYAGSMAAAQSGIQDYLGHLNRDDTYGTTPDCTNVALQGPTTVSNTCGWTSSTAAGWLPVQPGETDPKAAWFHYAVDATQSASTGAIKVTSTGRVNGVYRTVESVVGKGGSTDYVYYTDFESADPDNVQAYPPSGATVVACGSTAPNGAKYWYTGRSSSSCQEITFISGDTLDGAVFSNDAVLSNGATFSGGFKSANPTCSQVTTNTGTWNKCLRSGSTANFGVQPALADPLYLDDTSASFAADPGCHYYGSTQVLFNSDGTMTVWNKTVNNGGQAPTAITAVGLATPSCGTLTQLDSAAGAPVPVPDEMVVYVAPAPASVTRRQCDSGQIGGSAGRTLPFGNYAQATAPIPSSSTSGRSYTYDTNMIETTKFCAEGNLYAEGTVKGRVTLAAAKSVIVTGDLVLAGGRNGADMLGLVATNSVEVYHPRSQTYSVQKQSASCTSSGTLTWRICPLGGTGTIPGWPTRYPDPTTGSNSPTTGIQIAGSIQTLEHSFLVQKYAEGSQLGTLDVFGSIAQRWRGIVGQSGSGGTGYFKLYEYDRRLTYARPPYFPTWVNSKWGEHYSGEINTAAGLKSP